MDPVKHEPPNQEIDPAELDCQRWTLSDMGLLTWTLSELYLQRLTLLELEH